MFRLYFQACRFILFFVAASASFSGYYEKSHFCEAGVAGAYDRAQFEAMVDGTAYRPYIYRQMLPEIANVLDRLAPTSLKARLYAHQSSISTPYLQLMAESPTASNKVYFFRYLVLYTLTFCFALISLYGMYSLCRALSLNEPTSVFAPVILILIVPYMQNTGGYFFDFPELALFAVASCVALKCNWWWITPIAALGAWNKESFVLFLLTLYPFTRRRHSRHASLLAVAILCAVYLCVSIPIRLHFANNPGSVLEFHLLDQLRFFSHLRTFLLSTDETYGVRALLAYSLLPLAMLVWVVRRAWKDLPPAVRQHAKIAAVINIPLYFLFCQAAELRDLSLLYPSLLFAIAVNINRWIQNSAQAFSRRVETTAI